MPNHEIQQTPQELLNEELDFFINEADANDATKILTDLMFFSEKYSMTVEDKDALWKTLRLLHAIEKVQKHKTGIKN